MGPRAVAILILLALLAPGALGSAASGEFVVVGSLALPQGAELEMPARGAYLAPWESGFQELRIEARSMRVHRYEVSYVQVSLPGGVSPNVGPDPNVSTYDLTDVTVTLAAGGDHSGWLGLYFPRGGGPLSATVGSALTVAGQAATRLGEGASRHNEADAPQPQTEGYDWQVQEPLLLATMDGQVRLQGSGQMKMQGPDLVFDARENRTTYDTGSEAQGDGPVGGRRSRWLFLEYEDATVTLASRQPFQVAAEALDLQWSGAASFRPVEGRMSAAGVAYEAGGQRVRVVGDFAGAAEPLRAGSDVRLRLRLAGDLAETTLGASESASVPLGVRPRGWAVALLALAAVLAAAALVVALRRRRARARPPPPRPPPAPPLASLGVRALMDEASYLGAMGQVEEALAHYARASELDPDGDADLQAAVLLLQSGGEPSRAEALAVKAFRRSPILVLEALYDVSGTFEPLRGRPGFEAALADAKRELGES